MANHNAGGIESRPNIADVDWVREQAAREVAGYYGMIENIDWNLGRTRDALEAANLTEEAHIIFFSDHGEMHGSHGLFRKTNPYEESNRVPMMVGGTMPNYGPHHAAVQSRRPRSHLARAGRDPRSGVDARHGLFARSIG